MFKKRNFIEKAWLKYTNRVKYKEYKFELKNHKQKEFINSFTGKNRLNNLNKIQDFLKTTDYINVNHSGNAGDIIYALPALKKLHEFTGASINLYLRLNQPLIFSSFKTHPLGNVMLNEKMVDMLIPLISAQNYINKCEAYSNQPIHIDLDHFRAGIFPLDRGNIARWCTYFIGVTPDLWKSWLKVKSNTSFNNTIILARSERYQNSSLNFSFLNKYKSIKFIGVASEYEALRKIIPGLEWLQVKTFLEMAEIIAGCKFFIGNQSFPFSIAEALKVPRILEICFDVITVVPEGENGYDFFFQEHFEWLVSKMNDN